jgi:hypothetical protein
MLDFNERPAGCKRWPGERVRAAPGGELWPRIVSL